MGPFVSRGRFDIPHLLFLCSEHEKCTVSVEEGLSDPNLDNFSVLVVKSPMFENPLFVDLKIIQDQMTYL